MPLTNKKNITYLGILVIIISLGTFLRLHNLGRYSIAGDEFYTILSANYISQEGGLQSFLNQPFFTNKDWIPSNDINDLMYSMARRDNGSGLFYLFILHYWIKIFGFEDWGIRLFSVLTNITLIFGVFYFCRTHLKSKSIGIVASFFASISPFLISYSQVARTYSLVFLMSLICSHYFLQTLKLDKNNNWKTFILYGVFSFLLLMSHYSSFVVLLFHAGFILLFGRKSLWNNKLKFLISASIPIIGTIFWLNSSGGKYSFHSIEISKIYYNNLAIKDGTEWLKTTSLSSLGNQILKVFALSNLFLDQLLTEAKGIKNYLFTILISVITIIFSKQNQLKLNSILYVIIDLIIFILLLNFVSNHGINFIILYLILVLFISNFKAFIPKTIEEKYILGIYIFSFLSLILFGLMDGNTFRIIPRYAGFGYIFGIITCCISFFKIWKNYIYISNFRVLCLCFFIILSSKELIEKIYQDKMAPYFYSWPKPRTKNQYILSARKIEKLYNEGDTIIYPSFIYQKSDFEIGMPHQSVQVAQYVNLYLSQYDKKIVQKIDTTNLNKIILKKISGEKYVIHRFNDFTYLKNW